MIYITVNAFKRTQRKIQPPPPEDLSWAVAESLPVVSTTGIQESNFLFSFSFFPAEYYTLCPGGEGFRPNPITIILEGQFLTSCHVDFNKENGLV